MIAFHLNLSIVQTEIILGIKFSLMVGVKWWMVENGLIWRVVFLFLYQIAWDQLYFSPLLLFTKLLSVSHRPLNRFNSGHKRIRNLNCQLEAFCIEIKWAIRRHNLFQDCILSIGAAWIVYNPSQNQNQEHGVAHKRAQPTNRCLLLGVSFEWEVNWASKRIQLPNLLVQAIKDSHALQLYFLLSISISKSQIIK